ncbi:CbiX/SirB N-terminal domain-containing protein [Microbispora rosea]
MAAVAREWARTRPWWSVSAAYASAAAPTPQDEVVRLTRAGAPKVVVAPYLLAPGYFADRVERDTMEAGAHAVAGVLGPAPELVTLLLERHAQAVRAASEAA